MKHRDGESIPEIIYADLNMGIWLRGPQPDRIPCPPEPYVLQSSVTAKLEAAEKLYNAADAYRQLCHCYKMGKPPSEKLFKALSTAKDTLAQYQTLNGAAKERE